MDDDWHELKHLLSTPGVDVDVRWPTQGSITPLMTAAATDRPEMCRLLLQHGADVSLVGDTGVTAVMDAVMSSDRRLAVLEVLLQHGGPGLDLEVRDKIGRTAVMVAVFCNSPRCLQMLLARGASMEGRYRSTGRTMVEQARRMGHRKVEKVLVVEEMKRALKRVLGPSFFVVLGFGFWVSCYVLPVVKWVREASR